MASARPEVVEGRAAAPPLPDFLARQLPFRRYALEVEGHRVHVMEAGPAAARAPSGAVERPGGAGFGEPARPEPVEGRAGDVAVVLLHGNPTWSFLWRRVAAALDGSGLRLVMPDLVGLGLSDKPRDPRWHTLPNHARVVAGVLDALALDRAVLVLHDWGGPIGMLACTARPDRLAGLVVTNTVLGPPRPGFRPTAFHRFARMPIVSDVAFRWLGFPQNALDRAQGDRASIRGDVARAYAWPLRARADRVAPLALARTVPDSLQHPSVPALSQVQAVAEAFRGPAAIVWGDRDPVLGRALSRAQKILPQAKVTHTPGGHFLQEEVPDAIAAAIREVAAAVR